MKNRFLLFLMLGVMFFAACSDDDDTPAVPPTLDDVIGTYSGNTLSAKINGEAAGENASAQIRRNSDSTTTLVLTNIISGYPTFEVPNVTYQSLSRTYYSQLSGSISDNITGLKVDANATVEENVMTLEVMTSEIAGTPVSAERYHNISFTGDMNIEFSGIESNATQTVFIDTPTNEDPMYINLRIENFAYKTIPFGTIELENLAFTQRGEVYAFSAKDQILNLPGLGDMGLSPEVTLTARGTILNGNELQLTLTVAASGLTVNVTFDGIANAFRDSYTMTEWATPEEKNYQQPLYLATSNEAADMFPTAGKVIGAELSPTPYPVTQDGDAAKIITRDTKGGFAFITVLPKSTAGTLFNGEFVLNATNTLNSTHFGEAFLKDTAPKTFAFTYKYTPGPTYYNTTSEGSGFNTKVTVEEVPDKVDQCSCIAYLYEVDDYSEYLDGTNINTSEKVIMKAAFYGNQQDSFTTQTVNFEETGNGTFDPSKKYKMAVVFTPSRDGDKYEGAPESTLWIQSFEVAY